MSRLTTFKGDGSNLTGIDATSIKNGSDVKVQANSHGAVVTGILTANSISITDGTTSVNKHSVGIGTTTTAGRDAGISTATGTIIYNASDNKLQVYNGTEWLAIKTLLNTFNVSYLVIGGGGGGGNYRVGGGGGAYRTNWNNESQGGGQSSGAVFTVDPNSTDTFAVEVGSGGSPSQSAAGGAGSQSRFNGIISDGGGGGGRYEAGCSKLILVTVLVVEAVVTIMGLKQHLEVVELMHMMLVMDQDLVLTSVVVVEVALVVLVSKVIIQVIMDFLVMEEQHLRAQLQEIQY